MESNQEEGKKETPNNKQGTQEKPKRKVRVGGIIIFIILLIILGILISYFFANEKILGNCNKPEDCGKYKVLYIKGEGYICANNLAESSSLKMKALVFKYANKNSNAIEPATCACENNQCKIIE